MIKAALLTAIAVLMSATSALAERIEFYPHEDEPMASYPFSRAVRVGDLLFLSGDIGLDAETGKLVSGGMAAEARQTLENIRATLAIHGLTMRHVVKCQVFLDDMSQWGAFNEVYVEFFEKPFPARAAIGADGLALGAVLEMDCIAAFSDEDGSD
jgi:reactive intermediate/imine deaminase